MLNNLFSKVLAKLKLTDTGIKYNGILCIARITWSSVVNINGMCLKVSIFKESLVLLVEYVITCLFLCLICIPSSTLKVNILPHLRQRKGFHSIWFYCDSLGHQTEKRRRYKKCSQKVHLLSESSCESSLRYNESLVTLGKLNRLGPIDNKPSVV